VAVSLWDFGEDAFVERALTMRDDDLAAIQRIAAVYETRRIRRRASLTCTSTPSLRSRTPKEAHPLASDRRHPVKDRPARLELLRPDPCIGL
jgi:hypothetical protein